MLRKEKLEDVRQNVKEHPEVGIEVAIEMAVGLTLLETLRIRSRGQDILYRYHVECALAWFKEHEPRNGARVPLKAALQALPPLPPHVFPPVVPHRPTIFEEWDDLVLKRKAEDE